ncbi:MAG: RelA/SpoT domain-containing protein [Abditibacteriota bacterium]|nr:RelA/SpoT domain-containing protein [Abditibacteriota bacterium]
MSKQKNDYIEYSKTQINRAGKDICNGIGNEKENLKIIDYWRELHSHPMHIVYIRLKRFIEEKNKRIKGKKYKSVVSARLKRLTSIKKKIAKKTELARMQDLGGCRLVVSTIKKVYDYSNKYRSHYNHDEYLEEKSKDYIKEPKKSGYRSLHIVLKYKSGTIERYKNKFIEIQFRTHLQHIWATAVETMGIFLHTDIKASDGEDEIKRFFVLVSSLFAIEEKQPVVPGTSDIIDDLVDELIEINQRKKYLERLSSITKVINPINKNIKKNKSKSNLYYLLILNYETQKLQYWTFRLSEEEQANKRYKDIETSIRNNYNIDAVLVRSRDFKTVKSAYPNYFYDIREFVNKVNYYINRGYRK